MVETALSFAQVARLTVVLSLAVGLAPLLVCAHSWFQAVKRNRAQRLEASSPKRPPASGLPGRRSCAGTQSERQAGQGIWIADTDGVETV